VYNTGLVQYRWTGLDLLTADRLKMQEWKIVNSSKYSLSSVRTFSTVADSYLRFPYLRFQSPRLVLSDSGGLHRSRPPKLIGWLRACSVREVCCCWPGAGNIDRHRRAPSSKLRAASCWDPRYEDRHRLVPLGSFFINFLSKFRAID